MYNRKAYVSLFLYFFQLRIWPDGYIRIFYTIGNFISYRIKTSGGAHYGGMEDVAYAPRRAGNL